MEPSNGRAQRAYVVGICDILVAEMIEDALLTTDLVVMHFRDPTTAIHSGYSGVVVTLDGGEPFSGLGSWNSRETDRLEMAIRN